MPLRIDDSLTAAALLPRIEAMFELSGAKILSLEKSWKGQPGAPVFTQRGRYTARGWTEWTQGFQYGSALLQFEATGEQRFLKLGRENTFQRMAPHVSHVGVHDHGFNNVSTYGNLRRLMLAGRIPRDPREMAFYELALKTSAAVQAARWAEVERGGGFIYSFNGPHSLFVDTMRSLRVLALGHLLGHVLMGERDRPICLLERLLQHADTTAAFNVYYGEGRDAYDFAGRTAHESVFNVNDGSYRCPSTQQGYSPFSTWTRGLAWAVLGFAEQLEFLAALPSGALRRVCRAVARVTEPSQVMRRFEKAALSTADFYLRHCCTDGIAAWDTGAPGLCRMSDYLDRVSDPFNDHEPMDSSAAVIAAQGFWRLAGYLERSSRVKAARGYRQAALTMARTLLNPPYLSTDAKHQGLLLHSVYHRPNGWDYVPRGRRIPCGESSQWGDYHLRELGLTLWAEAKGLPAYRFF